MTETHGFTTIKLVQDKDLQNQIGKYIYFDLVALDKVKSFIVTNDRSFNDFKEKLATVLDIPAQFQRFWVFAERQNKTYRPSRPLTYNDESVSIGQLKLVKKAELVLFLEVERGLEISFEPYVMCIPIDKNLTFIVSQLENGDILCFQRSLAAGNEKSVSFPDVPSYLEHVHRELSAKEFKVQKLQGEQNKIIIVEDANVDKNTEAQRLEVNVVTTHDENPSKNNNSKFIIIDSDEIDALMEDDVIDVIDRVLSKEITISLQSHPSVLGQEVTKLDHHVRLIVNLLNKIVRMFDKLENLKKERDTAKKCSDEDNEALRKKRQKILTLKTSFNDRQTELKSIDAKIADLKGKLEKLQGVRVKLFEIQDQEKDKITSFNKQVKSDLYRPADNQIKLSSVECNISNAQTELESYEKVYNTFRTTPPF